MPESILLLKKSSLSDPDEEQIGDIQFVRIVCESNLSWMIEATDISDKKKQTNNNQTRLV